MLKALRQIVGSRYSFGIVVAVFAVGVVFTVGLGQGMSFTNKTDFCITCHEMNDTVYQELRQTIHFSNRTGVQAGCADCHVPKHDLLALLERKLLASNDVLHHLLGTIDTKEKFEARRLDLAKRVWATMKATDSRECRSCHTATAMDFERQKSRSAGQHTEGFKNGETCIDCHKGIAHKPVHKQLEAPEEQDFDLSDRGPNDTQDRG